MRIAIVMEVFSLLPDELILASDTSNTVGVIGEQPPVNAVHVRVLLKEKPTDHSLRVAYPAMQNLNVQRH
jgi:hypothetical protein